MLRSFRITLATSTVLRDGGLYTSCGWTSWWLGFCWRCGFLGRDLQLSDVFCWEKAPVDQRWFHSVWWINPPGMASTPLFFFPQETHLGWLYQMVPWYKNIGFQYRLTQLPPIFSGTTSRCCLRLWPQPPSQEPLVFGFVAQAARHGNDLWRCFESRDYTH